jgi:hypothetical protein
VPELERTPHVRARRTVLPLFADVNIETRAFVVRQRRQRMRSTNGTQQNSSNRRTSLVTVVSGPVRRTSEYNRTVASRVRVYRDERTTHDKRMHEQRCRSTEASRTDDRPATSTSVVDVDATRLDEGHGGCARDEEVLVQANTSTAQDAHESLSAEPWTELFSFCVETIYSLWSMFSTDDGCRSFSILVELRVTRNSVFFVSRTARLG